MIIDLLSIYIIQKLLFRFRNLYIGLIKAYPINNTSEYLKEGEMLNDLPDWLIRELDATPDTELKGRAKKLYLITFNEDLTTDQAECKLRQLGFLPADIFETVLFIKKYKNLADKYAPIVSLNAYHDFSNSLGSGYKGLKRLGYDFCLVYACSGYAKPGEIESYEAIDDAIFKQRVRFLAKPILIPENNNHKTAEEFHRLVKEAINKQGS